MRKYMDCRDFPSESNCSLRISGTEQEVLDTAYDHAIKVHGHLAGTELREALRRTLKDEEDTGADTERYARSASTVDQAGL